MKEETLKNGVNKWLSMHSNKYLFIYLKLTLEGPVILEKLGLKLTLAPVYEAVRLRHAVN